MTHEPIVGLPERLGLSGEFQPLIEGQLRILNAMILPNGAVLASPNAGYRAHWVRDGLYVSTAAVTLGLSDLSHRLIRAPFSIFQKHRAKILGGIRKPPGKNFDFIHARYHPTHFDEFADEWGHNQLDMIGLFLHLVARLPEKGIDVFQYGRQHEDRILLSHITRYLETLEWWKCPDYGVWEEGPKLNSSSLGAVLSGLQGLIRLDDPDLFFNEAQLEKGQAALRQLLPSESEGRSCDLAQLSLIWPFDVLDDGQAKTVLANVESELVRERGVIRYRRDAYFNGNDPRLITVRDARIGRKAADYEEADKKAFPYASEGTEAQWPLGLAWLSIVHAKLAKKARFGTDASGDPAALEKSAAFHKERAAYYMAQLAGCAVPVTSIEPGYIPELYVGDRPNLNTPLTWATAFCIVAAVALSEIDDPGVPYSVL